MYRLSKLIKIIYYIIVNKKIDWNLVPYKKEKINTHLVGYSSGFPNKYWDYNAVKIDNTNMYNTEFARHTERVISTRVEYYRDLVKIMLLPRVLILEDGTILSTWDFKGFVLSLVV